MSPPSAAPATTWLLVTMWPRVVVDPAGAGAVAVGALDRAGSPRSGSPWRRCWRSTRSAAAWPRRRGWAPGRRRSSSCVPRSARTPPSTPPTVPGERARRRSRRRRGRPIPVHGRCAPARARRARRPGRRRTARRPARNRGRRGDLHRDRLRGGGGLDGIRGAPLEARPERLAADRLGLGSSAGVPGALVPRAPLVAPGIVLGGHGVDSARCVGRLQDGGPRGRPPPRSPWTRP